MLKRALEPMKGFIDLPGGFMDITDASIEASGYREIDEEIGLKKSDVNTLRYLGSGSETYEWQSTTLDTVCFYFISSLSDTSKIRLDKIENSEIMWVNKSDIATINFAWDIDKRMLEKYYREKELRV